MAQTKLNHHLVSFWCMDVTVALFYGLFIKGLERRIAGGLVPVRRAANTFGGRGADLVHHLGKLQGSSPCWTSVRTGQTSRRNLYMPFLSCQRNVWIVYGEIG